MLFAETPPESKRQSMDIALAKARAAIAEDEASALLVNCQRLSASPTIKGRDQRLLSAAIMLRPTQRATAKRPTGVARARGS